MAEQSDAQNYSASSFWAAPARNFRTSARLHLQHLLFQNTLGFLLEPRVHSSLADAKSPRVADLGCGNGAWLLGLDTELSSKGISAQLDGFDINEINFPAAEFLPANVSLKPLNILARPLPEELLGAYDVVHVRAFISVIVNSNLEPLLSTAIALLKPGGWLQWEETRTDTWQAEVPSAGIPKTACETIISIINAGGEARGASYEFLAELDQHVKAFGYQDVESQYVKKNKRDLKAWTEDYLLVWEELAGYFPSRSMVPNAPMSREAYVELFGKVVSETEQGAVVHQREIVVVSGRKPASH